MLAWSFASQDLNLYTDRWYAVDRVLLVAAALLVFAHPAFVAPTLVLAALLVLQLQHPLGGFSWTDKLPLFHLLILFSAYASLHALRRVDSRLFVALALSLHAADYVVPGLGKLEIDWATSQRMAEVWIPAHLNGWLPELEEGSLFAVARLLDLANPLLIWGTLLIELGPILWLASRRYAVAGLAAATALHAGIFLFSGIFFWKWMLLNLAWIAVLVGPERRRWETLFGPRAPYLWLSLLLVLGGSALSAPVRLAWINVPLEHTYELEAVGRSGRVYPVGRDLLSPYDLGFAQNRFAYLVDEPHLAMTYGGTRDLEAAAALQRATTPAEVLAADRRYGRVYSDAERTRRFRRFVERVFQNLNRRGHKPRFPLGAPAHIWAWGGAEAYALQEPVSLLRVRWRSTWFDAGAPGGALLRRLRDRVVLEIPIEAADAAGVMSDAAARETQPSVEEEPR